MKKSGKNWWDGEVGPLQTHFLDPPLHSATLIEFTHQSQIENLWQENKVCVARL